MGIMRFRTLALALALSCGFTGLAEAKRKPAVHHVKRHKSSARVNGRKVKPHKVSAQHVKRRAKHS